jgi:GcrA cell cycle regulator
MWLAGRPRDDMAEVLGCNPSTISLLAKKLELPPRANSNVANTWTTARDEELKKLWVESPLAAKDIAVHFNERDQTSLTKNAIIGRADRLNLPPRDRAARAAAAPRPTKLKKARAPRPRREPTPRLPRAAKPAPPVCFTALSHQPIDQVRAPRLIIDNAREGAIPLAKLGHNTCRWPFGTPGDDGFGFCGCKAVALGPYCLEHAELAYEPAPARAAAGGR